MIAPDSNRSATARSITTRSPLWVEEIEFDDGDRASRPTGTPVDCVRFAELGLLGERPDLIVSGINHGSNLGDDITYSGTVAAALEGIVLGVPAIAVSQQSAAREMGFALGRELRLRGRRGRSPPQLVERLAGDPMPDGHADQRQLPRRRADRGRGHHARQAPLQRRDEAGRGGRRRAGAATEIYGFEPSFEDEEGTDLSAVARGRIAVTPVHFDLTDHGGLDALKGWDLERDARRLGDRREPRSGELSPRRAATRAAELRRRDRAPRPPLLRPRRPRDRRRRLRRRCSTSCASSRPSTPSCGRPTRRPSASAARRWSEFEQVEHAEPMLSLGQRPQRGGAARLGERGSATCSSASTSSAARVRLRRPSRRSTAWRSR